MNTKEKPQDNQVFSEQESNQEVSVQQQSAQTETYSDDDRPRDYQDPGYINPQRRRSR